MRTRAVLWALAGSVALASSVLVTSEEKPPADLPDLAEPSKLQARMPKTVSGVVTLSGKGLEGARVTDGVDFATTGADGRYTITLKPDPLIPYLPSRTVAVSWPNGTWPMRDEKTGRYMWWARLMDIKEPNDVNFELVPREVNLPMCVMFATDPHDLLKSPDHAAWRDLVASVPRPGEPQYWTKQSFPTLLYIDKAGFDFVDWDNSGDARNGWDGVWNKGGPFQLALPDPATTQQAEHVELKDVSLDSGSREISVVKGATCDVRVGAKSAGSKPAKRWGIRLKGQDGTTQGLAYDHKDKMMSLMGRRTPFNPTAPPLLAEKGQTVSI